MPLKITIMRRREVIRNVLRDRLTYLDKRALNDLFEIVDSAEKRRIAGAVVEAGCALGGSAIVLASAKAPEREMFVYDTFRMIPPPSPADGEDVQRRYETIAMGRSLGISGDVYYGYQPDLLGKVVDAFRRYGIDPDEHSIRFVKGLYEETLHSTGPIAVAHVDCDWYESVLTCLARLHPFMVVGGHFVIDDYYTWSGCRRAVDEFRKQADGYAIEKRARLHLVRVH